MAGERERKKQIGISIGINKRKDTEVEIDGESKVTSASPLRVRFNSRFDTNGAAGKATTLWNVVEHGISNSPVGTGRHLCRWKLLER